MAIGGKTQTSSIGPGTTDTSRQLYEAAREYSPQGAHGEGKYYPPYPHFWRRALGSRLWDVDGNEYIDYWCAAGPAILGHNHPGVREAVKRTLEETGVLFCGPHPDELQLAKLLRKHIPTADMSGYGCGGSDAIVYALRAARAHTGRTKLLRFEGSYHGWYDGVLFSIAPKPGQVTEGEYAPISESSGLPPEAAQHVVVAPYNDADMLEQLVIRHKNELAAIIVEPISHTMGVVEPVSGFLERARQLCDRYGIVLVFDEIITGFRHSLGGVQKLSGVLPDISAFGKAMSNGFPISAVCGRNHVMGELTPQGRAYFSGTFNGNPLCVAAAISTVSELENGRIHERLFRLGKITADGINKAARELNVRARCVQFGSIWTVFFTDRPIGNYRDILKHHNADASRAFVRYMWNKGFYSKPKTVSRWYLNGAHTEDDVDRTIAAVKGFFAEHGASLR